MLQKPVDAQLAEIESMPPEEREQALAMRAAFQTYFAKVPLRKCGSRGIDSWLFQMAGGFKEQYDQERSFEEAFLSLF